jgi:hypothetical protein
MDIGRARAALAGELMSDEPAVVAVGQGCRNQRPVLTVLLDGAPSREIPAVWGGFAVEIQDCGAFYGAAAPQVEAREVA